jgi:hypothetical protein
MVCYGTGNTDGYQMYGHRTEVFDSTAEAATVGCVVDYDCITRPLQYRLVNQSTKGYIDFTLPIQGGNLSGCSLASLHAVAGRGSRVRAGVKRFTESEFVDLSTSAVASRLVDGAREGGLHLRVVLERDSVTATSPRLSHLRIRYQTLADDRIRADIPRSTEVNRTSEFGWFDDIATKTMFIDGTLRSVTTEDLFRMIRTGKLFKALSINANAPSGVLTSWDVDIRQVMASERYAMLP